MPAAVARKRDPNLEGAPAGFRGSAGKDSKYEWAGYVPFDKLPKSLNGAAGFYNSSNNDVVPKIVPSTPPNPPR